MCLHSLFTRCSLGSPDPGGDYVSSLSVHPVFSRFTIMMIILTLLQSVLSGSSRQKFAPGSLYRRKFVSPEVCAGSCARPSGGPGIMIRVVLFALVAARVLI